MAPSSIAPTLFLATPYLADVNNGNWRTAERWARLLAPRYAPILQASDAAAGDARLDTAAAMIALHARRSRPAIAAWRARRPGAPLVVALTGTDLYRDVPARDADALASIDDADALVVLQADALRHLTERARERAHVVFQSAEPLAPLPDKPDDRLHCALVAHLRDEKDPRTVFAAWRALARDLPITLAIVGAPLDPALGEEAHALAAEDARVRFDGPQPHEATREAIRRAHVLLVPSRMEGGANVVVEAVVSGTAVIGSRMSGNTGMLGDDYPGLFPVGDAGALAAMLSRAHRDRAFLRDLERRCRALAPRFAPEAERAALSAALDAAAARAAGRMEATRLSKGPP